MGRSKEYYTDIAGLALYRVDRWVERTRLYSVAYLQVRFQPLNAADQFRSILGTIQFYVNEGLGESGIC